jgi:glyoxylase-like metal-dependent hydrolase (beta-lactamase superfamily II)
MDQAVSVRSPYEAPPARGTTIEVAPGIHWVRMPLPFALDHINLWLLEDEDGITLVDCGLGGQLTHDIWGEVLAAWLPQRPVRRIIVTHFHPDHIGMAAQLAADHGVTVSMTLGEFLAAHAIWQQIPGFDIESMARHFTSHGLSATVCDALRNFGNRYRKGAPALPSRFDRLFDNGILSIGGRQWRIICGHGHSPEHASLYCESAGVLISGDMVLPRISTNVGVHASSPDDDALAQFLDSLARLSTLPHDTLVLPSHGLPFYGLQARIAALGAHHDDRCAELLAAIDRPASAADLLPVLFSRPLDTFQTMFAMSEAIAHLNHVLHAGKASKVESLDGIIRFVGKT